MIINECGGDGGMGRFKCPSCNGSGCFRDENILLLERLAQRQQWKRCPQCHIYVKRRGGDCKKIVCRCQTRFCYGCRRKNGSSFCACREEVRESIFIAIFQGFTILLLFILAYKLWLG